MKYRLRHLTTYRYGSTVTFSQCALTLTPPSADGQTVERADITIVPKPKVVTEHPSFFGHVVTMAEIHAPHRELRIEANAVVRVDRKTGHASVADQPWETVRDTAVASASLAPAAPVHFMFPSPRVPMSPAVTAYARTSFPAAQPIREGAQDFMRRIRREFRYAPDATRVTTPLAEAFEKRHGVCQDFAHIMIAGFRGLGLPARYVSGYIRTIPPDGQARLEGADATHAWVDLWCGPEMGWVGLDPTNAILAGDDHIVLATGRDYADVAPVGGILLGSSDQSIRVNVDVVPIEEPEEPCQTPV